MQLVTRRDFFQKHKVYRPQFFQQFFKLQEHVNEIILVFSFIFLRVSWENQSKWNNGVCHGSVALQRLWWGHKLQRMSVTQWHQDFLSLFLSLTLFCLILSLCCSPTLSFCGTSALMKWFADGFCLFNLSFLSLSWNNVQILLQFSLSSLLLLIFWAQIHASWMD